MSFDPTYGGFLYRDNITGETSRSDYPTTWDQALQSAREAHSRRADAWREQNPERPGYENPYRGR